MTGEKQASVTEKEERKKIDLKIAVEDFGPISSGEIALKPLTVFIGPNNSGKSYAAMLIHSIFESYAAPRVKRPFNISVRNRPELEKRLNDLAKGQKLDISPYIEIPAEALLKDIYEKTLGDRITYSFACRIGELIRMGKDSFSLGISYDSKIAQLLCQEGTLVIRDYLMPDMDMGMRVWANGKDNYRLTIPIELEDGSKTLIFHPLHRDDDMGAAILTYVEDMSAYLPVLLRLTNQVLENVRIQCHYLPAAKSGIVQVYKAFITSMVKSTSMVKEKPEIPRLSGVVSDLL